MRSRFEGPRERGNVGAPTKVFHVEHCPVLVRDVVLVPVVYCSGIIIMQETRAHALERCTRGRWRVQAKNRYPSSSSIHRPLELSVQRLAGRRGVLEPASRVHILFLVVAATPY
jgi:hypothetical protein